MDAQFGGAPRRAKRRRQGNEKYAPYPFRTLSETQGGKHEKNLSNNTILNFSLLPNSNHIHKTIRSIK